MEPSIQRASRRPVVDALVGQILQTRHSAGTCKSLYPDRLQHSGIGEAAAG